MKKNSSINKIPFNIREILLKNLEDLRPIQKKALDLDIFNTKDNILVSSPTASGKTLISEMLFLDTILNKKKKAIYIVPLKALASEKYKEFNYKYGNLFKIRVSYGDNGNDFFNLMFDLLIVTSEKLDSLIRHNKDFLKEVELIVVDEIHLLNDEKRGPTLEILLTLFKTIYRKIRIIGLSATISNGNEIAKWLKAKYIEDDWRPVELQHYILNGNKLKRYK